MNDKKPSKFQFHFLRLLKSSQNKKGQKNFQVHSFRCPFLQLAAEKKTPKTVHLEIFFGPSYFETTLVACPMLKKIKNKCPNGQLR